jgi:2-oxoacid:acceptor oxidoreductase gamma subunit (pyruvate/2-ketoisovalerate family)
MPDSANGLWEIKWHGRGGQGAISSAQILAHAGFLGGYRGVTSAPSFGAERRGAPVTASTHLSPDPIRIVSQIETPDIVVVLDDTLLNAAHAVEELKPGGWLVVNSTNEPPELGVSNVCSIATADATAVAQEVDLVVAGSPMVNTAMLGAFAKATGLVTLDDIQQALARKFRPAQAEKNAEAARLTFERTKVMTPGID